MPVDHIASSPFQELPVAQENSSKSSFWKAILLKHCRDLQDGQLWINDDQGRSCLGSGNSIQAHMTVHHPSVYRRIALGGTMALAETYMEGLWESKDLFSLFRLFALQRASIEKIDGPLTRWATPLLKLGEWFVSNTLHGSKKNISAHYDLGNDLFKLFLDPTLTYSSAYFERPEMSLEEASIAKYDRMCRQIELKATDHVIEIGSGWGSFAIHAASHYSCQVTTVTLSEEQKKCAEERIRARGLQNKIQVLLQDYRHIQGTYDKCVSIEMIEAVGPQFLGTFFKKIDSILKPKGIAAIQAITLPDQAYGAHLNNVDFIQKYIFPGSKIPCVSVLLEEAKNNSRLVLGDLKDITQDYAQTMLIWRKNFISEIEKVKALGYDERFVRMWDYYLNYCAAGFAERYLGTVQMQFRKL